LTEVLCSSFVLNSLGALPMGLILYFRVTATLGDLFCWLYLHDYLLPSFTMIQY
jgi:hypothetical protein